MTKAFLKTKDYRLANHWTESMDCWLIFGLLSIECLFWAVVLATPFWETVPRYDPFHNPRTKPLNSLLFWNVDANRHNSLHLACKKDETPTGELHHQSSPNCMAQRDQTRAWTVGPSAFLIFGVDDLGKPKNRRYGSKALLLRPQEAFPRKQP